MKSFIFLSLLCFSQISLAQEIPLNSDDLFNQEDHYKSFSGMGFGEIIAIGQSVVGLGESVYTLVQKGAPTSTTQYEKIDVLPLDPATNRPYLDIFDYDMASQPITKKFRSAIYNGFRQKVGVFEYLVTFNTAALRGRGKYIQNAVIIPTSINTTFGRSFKAEMKLIGVSNIGTSQNPIAAALLSMSYSTSSVVNKVEQTTLVSISGDGLIRVQDKL